ncbi:hypothetical protein ACFV6F_06980 [Kitasatospora phosalacinea]|uniref:hypothetical protein n=1 Tax=Kitasatospora phosalacinea TaxID=2065 RepID=UPI00366863E9
MTDEPLLCLPDEGAEGLITHLRAALSRAPGFDPALNTVAPVESAASAAVAVEVRMRVLLDTYRGDYRTDSFAVERLAAQVREQRESIWFWGGSAEVSRLRAALRGGRLPADWQPALGTVTVLDAEAEFGPGHGELCRSGSTSGEFGAKAPIMWRTLGFLDGRESGLRDAFHSLVLTPRNRPSTATVRGGEAIHRIHTHYVRSRFWGYAPWYVMQGGVLELTEFRESNRDPQDVRTALESTGTWYFADAAEADFAAALCRISFDVGVPTQVGTGSATRSLRARLTTPASADLERDNHGTVSVDEDGPLLFEDALEQLDRLPVCCAVAHVPLTDPATVPLQRLLGERGFRLTAVLPPKRTWIVRDGVTRDIETRPTGMWSRPRPGLPVVAPYYTGSVPGTRAERTVLSYLRDRLAFGAQGTT